MSGTAVPVKSAIEQLAGRGFEDHPLVQAFRRDLILHTRFQSALDQMAERIQFGEQQSITAVLGPTGSGKTALVTEFGYQFSQAMKPIPEAARTTLLCMELAAPEQGTFKWKDDFYLPALTALLEPCTTKKINVEALRERLASGDTKAIYSAQNQTSTIFRNLFYGALERAKVIAALFDEGNHLRRPASKSGVFSQYDSLKSRSNACRTHFALLGTTEMADIFRQSGPISKRVYPIWLSPYGPETAEKLLFGGAVLSIVQKLPGGMKITFSVETKLDDLHKGSLGVYGIVHEWFDRALVRAIRLEKNTVSWADMTEVALDPLQLAGIVNELIKYRDVMSGAKTYLKEKMASLFLPIVPAPKASDPKPDAGSPAHSGSAAKPGVRKPERDKVGA
jgi:AAA domain